MLTESIREYSATICMLLTPPKEELYGQRGKEDCHEMGGQERINYLNIHSQKFRHVSTHVAKKCLLAIFCKLGKQKGEQLRAL